MSNHAFQATQPAESAEREFNERQALLDLGFNAEEAKEAAILDAIHSPDKTAQYLILADEWRIISKFLRIAAASSLVPPGPFGDDFRRKMLQDLQEVATEAWTLKAESEL